MRTGCETVGEERRARNRDMRTKELSGTSEERERRRHDARWPSCPSQPQGTGFCEVIGPQTERDRPRSQGRRCRDGRSAPPRRPGRRARRWNPTPVDRTHRRRSGIACRQRGVASRSERVRRGGHGSGPRPEETGAHRSANEFENSGSCPRLCAAPGCRGNNLPTVFSGSVGWDMRKTARNSLTENETKS